MKREFWAEFDLFHPLTKKGKEIRGLQNELDEIKRQLKGTQDEEKAEKLRKHQQELQEKLKNIQKEVRSLVNKILFANGIHFSDFAARQAYLAQLLAVDCICEGRTTQCKDYVKGPNGLQRWYYAGDLQNPRGDYQCFLCQRLRWMGDILGFANYHETVGSNFPDLSIFPPNSWALQIIFTLKKPYLSKDDVDFYIIDNPVKKEWVFKVPYVTPSQWKGALRAVIRRQRGYTTWQEEAQDDQMIRLFGNVKGESEEFSAGRLHFYPTFFDHIGLEVINPHDRETGAGKQPIYFECVPADTQGIFTLLYVPLDLVGKVSREEMEDEAKEDLATVAQGVRAMLTEYGFGAKTSSGYGVADVAPQDIAVEPKPFSKPFIEAWKRDESASHNGGESNE